MREMLELRRAEAVDVYVGIFFADVPEQFEVPIERQPWMVPPLHQDLNTAGRGKFVEFLVELLPAEHVVIFVFLGAIERAELAVNVADVGIVDVAIDNVSDDLAAALIITGGLRQVAPGV